jgi:hypothetical protein
MSGEPDAGFPALLNRTLGAAGVEVVQKIVKCQLQVPEGLGTDPVGMWHRVLATGFCTYLKQNPHFIFDENRILSGVI